MPIYKGSTEVTSGNLRKGSTNIENGYKETSPFYTNTNGITINFIDAISGATMSTTQFSSVGVPGASFSSFSRTITVDSGRTFSTNPTVSESGDSGNNVTTSISSQTSTSAVLNVSGTYPTSGTTVTLTVNGATQVQLPSLSVSVATNNASFSTSDSSALNTFNYTTSAVASGGGANPSCSGGTGNTSGTLSSGSSSYTWNSFQAGYPAGGDFGNGCGVTCTSSVSASKSGYNSGSNSYAYVGSFPFASYTCNAASVSGISPRSQTDYAYSSDCNNNYPSTKAVNGTAPCISVGPYSFGCSNCMYSGGQTGGSVTITCPAVPANGTSTSTAAGCATPTYAGMSLSGGSLSPNIYQATAQYVYVSPGNISISYNKNYDPYALPAGWMAMSCTANSQTHSGQDYISGTDIGWPSGQFQSGTTNFTPGVTDSPVFFPSDFGLSTFSGTSMTCTATLPLASGGYNAYTISGTSTFTVN